MENMQQLFGQRLFKLLEEQNISQGEFADNMVMLQDFVIEMESPITREIYGTKEENEKMAREFCLYVINQFFSDILRDICK